MRTDTKKNHMSCKVVYSPGYTDIRPFSINQILYYKDFLELSADGKISIRHNLLPEYQEDEVFIYNEDITDLWYTYPSLSDKKSHVLRSPVVIPKNSIIFKSTELLPFEYRYSEWDGNKCYTQFSDVEIIYKGDDEYEFISKPQEVW